MMNYLGHELGSEWLEEHEEKEPLDSLDEIPEAEKPIELRATEAERLYANLLMVTDFERSFIEDVLEFEPDEESEMRIGELRRKRREMKDLAQVPQTQTIVL